MTLADPQCALWYWRYGTPAYELCESEAEAANLAVQLDEWGNGVPESVQHADGRTIAVSEWPEYAAAYQRHLARMRDQVARHRAAAIPRPTRTIRVPFGDNLTLDVDGDEPDWLGLRSGD